MSESHQIIRNVDRELKLISEIKIENFLRIDNEISMRLAHLNVLVGENGAGKSSVLKALHWAVRCATLRDRNGKVTLEQMDYVPSKDFLELGHKLKLQNSAAGRKTTVTLVDENRTNTKIEISAARNDAGIKVDINGPLLDALTSDEKPSTAFIPGLSGMAEEETILAVPVLHRKASSGESGSTLRQILLQYSAGAEGTGDDYSELEELSSWVGKVLPGARFWIKFDRLRDRNIDVKFLTPDMKVVGQSDRVAWKSIDMAGTGFLQVVQIFAYLLYFRPKLLLVDEPDSHLHPTRQKALMKALSEATVHFPDTQIIISTHSPTLVKALPNNANISWVSDGRFKAQGSEVRERMGWNALDKEIIIFSEDGNTKYLDSILEQWPSLHNKCLIWPTFGKDGLPNGPRAREIADRMNVGVLIHRDRDFMSDDDVQEWANKKQYPDNDISYWVPQGSDIESIFLDDEHIKLVLDVEDDVFNEILDNAFGKFVEGDVMTEFSNAYNAAIAKLGARDGRNPIARWNELGGFCPQVLKGKDFLAAVRRACVEVLPIHGMGRAVGRRDAITYGRSERPLVMDLHDQLIALL